METDPLSQSTTLCLAEIQAEETVKSAAKYEGKNGYKSLDLADFICFVCNNEFDDMAKLHVHMSMKHKGIKVCRVSYNHSHNNSFKRFQTISHTDVNIVERRSQQRKVCVCICNYIISAGTINIFVCHATHIFAAQINCSTIMRLSIRKVISVGNAVNASVN